MKNLLVNLALIEFHQWMVATEKKIKVRVFQFVSIDRKQNHLELIHCILSKPEATIREEAHNATWQRFKPKRAREKGVKILKDMTHYYNRKLCLVI